MGNVAVSTEIDAPPELVYDLVADLPRMGSWSPECERVEWRDGATSARPGARFVGRNRLGARRWSTRGVVDVADRPRELAFEVSVLRRPVSRWSYSIEPSGRGCRVTEATVDRRDALLRALGRVATGVADREARNRQTMTETLARLKTAAEALAARR